MIYVHTNLIFDWFNAKGFEHYFENAGECENSKRKRKLVKRSPIFLWNIFMCNVNCH